MRNFKLFFVAILAAFITTTLSAQSYNNKNESGLTFFYYSPVEQNVTMDIVDFITSPIERHFLEAEAPRFVLTDSKGKFALGIGGVARGVTSVDFQGIIPTSTNEGFQTAFIPTAIGNLPKAQAQMSAATSEIFVKMVGNTGRLGNFSVYVSMNFMGKNYTPQLRNAYVDFLGLSVGQRWSNMTDLAALPPTIDYGGPISYAGYHVPQIRYTRMFADQAMQFAVSAENPVVNATYSNMDVAQPQGCPNIVGYMQTNFRDGGHLRVSGIYRNMNYKNLTDFSTDTKDGWGVQLSGTGNISKTFKVYYQGIYGKGIASYMNDLSNFDYDLMPSSDANGNMAVLPMWGSYGTLQCNFCPSVYASGTYSYSRVYDESGFDTPSQYKYAQYCVGNVFWDITDECTVGVEYLYGCKRTHAGGWGAANRANLMVQYTF